MSGDTSIDLAQSTSPPALGICTSTDCTEAATRYVEIPSFVRYLPPHRYPYCDSHAEMILADGMSFPGARDITGSLLKALEGGSDA